jgi:hypothetical protein
MLLPERGVNDLDPSGETEEAKE